MEEEGVSHCTPSDLPSEWYADASHPLEPGYRRIAEELFYAAAFQAWLQGVMAAATGSSPISGVTPGLEARPGHDDPVVPPRAVSRGPAPPRVSADL